MNKNDKKLEQRANYIKMRCDAVKNKTTEIRKLADELFVSERTIWRDLRRL